jgi:hypothetical protein
VDFCVNGFACQSDSLRLQLMQKIDFILTYRDRRVRGTGLVRYRQTQEEGFRYGIFVLQSQPRIEALIDEHERLQGAVSIKQLVLSDPETALKQLSGSRLVSVKVEEEWEEVAETFYKYNFLAMPVVGGRGSIFGAVAGACLLSWLDLELRNILSIPYLGAWLEQLSKSYFSITGVSNIQFIIYGLIMVLIMVFEPLGIYGFWIRTKLYWKTWPF